MNLSVDRHGAGLSHILQVDVLPGLAWASIRKKLPIGHGIGRKKDEEQTDEIGTHRDHHMLLQIQSSFYGSGKEPSWDLL